MEQAAPNESYNPWTVVNLVFHHLAEQGLHPTFSDAGDPGEHATRLLQALGIEPRAEGNRQAFEDTKDELARIRAAVLGEA
ncbi:MAG TPA: hypothetical protein VGD73_05705 [Pseudonocardia sp.]|jgi:hypothetical protein|uniref:hypothetical protein n=1 Tax=Pseudonocardia sp. TaxID=60912 RepID=UPI002ED7B53C